jgi:hypothetical protein
MKSGLLLSFILLGAMPVNATASGTLLGIMQQLNADTLALTSAIMNEDWVAMEKAGKAIADHPKAPVEERKQIVAHLGEQASAFVAYDRAVHDAAMAIAQAAAQHDLESVNREYATMIEACSGCHADFRDKLKAVLKQAGMR